MAGQESLLFERRNKPEFEGLNSFHGGHCRRKTRTESQCMDGPAVRAILPRAFRARFAAQFDQNSRLSRLPPEKRIPLFSTCWISYSILPSLSRRHDFCIYSAPPPALENRRMVFDFLGGGLDIVTAFRYDRGTSKSLSPEDAIRWKNVPPFPNLISRRRRSLPTPGGRLPQGFLS